MRGLKICLWITGILCLSSVVGLFLPFSAYEAIGRSFGIETLPDWPLFMYGIRTVAATFVGIGIYFIILALEPMKYKVLVPFSGLVALFIGIVCMIAGTTSGMPVMWYMSDALSCIILGSLILIFWQRAKKTTIQQPKM
jgi:hypothetical protein